VGSDSDPVKGFSEPYYLIFDPHCTVCSIFAAVVNLLDINGRITFLSLYGMKARMVAADLSPDEYSSSFHIVPPASEVLSGENALPLLISLFPHGDALVRVLEALPGGTTTLSVLYRGVVRGRTILLCGSSIDNDSIYP
jgi:predicted DCC family thiol-disulfide oxidoreductase YuxK